MLGATISKQKTFLMMYTVGQFGIALVQLYLLFKYKYAELQVYLLCISFGIWLYNIICITNWNKFICMVRYNPILNSLAASIESYVYLHQRI